MKIESKTDISNLDIEFQGTHGLRLTIERPNKEDVFIVVDIEELKQSLGEKQ